MKRNFRLSKLSFDAESIRWSMSAVGTLELRTGDRDYYPSRLTVDAQISDELNCKIIRLVEDEIAAMLKAEPASTGKPVVEDVPV